MRVLFKGKNGNVVSEVFKVEVVSMMVAPKMAGSAPGLTLNAFLLVADETQIDGKTSQAVLSFVNYKDVKVLGSVLIRKNPDAVEFIPKL